MFKCVDCGWTHEKDIQFCKACSGFLEEVHVREVTPTTVNYDFVEGNEFSGINPYEGD